LRYGLIQAQAGEHSVARLCQALEVSRAGYYGWLRSPESQQEREDRRLLAQIRTVYRKSRHRYGSPRVHAQLRSEGVRCSRKRVARLMRQDRLCARPRRRFKVTTQSGHSQPVPCNHLQRRFGVEAPNTCWAADITYIWTEEGWLYLAVLLDLCSRRVVGWSTSDRLGEELTLRALDRALADRRPAPGLLHHSDRGSQYASRAYRCRLINEGIEASMSRRGDCWDNAPVESFFSSLKTELFSGRVPSSRRQARSELFEYIEVFYNRQRRHSALGYQTPAEFEKSQARAVA
jgi:putative transposase